jgi:hypothetical protein
METMDQMELREPDRAPRAAARGPGGRAGEVAQGHPRLEGLHRRRRPADAGFVLGIIGAQPLAIVVSIAAILGGIVGFGANVSTARQDKAAMQAAAAARADLISRLEMRDVGQGTSLSFYQ